MDDNVTGRANQRPIEDRQAQQPSLSPELETVGLPMFEQRQREEWKRYAEAKELAREIMHREPTVEETGQVRARLDQYGRDGVWTTTEAQELYQFLGFGAPVVAVVRRSDGAKGSIYFDHSPRLYFNFRKHNGS